MNRIKELRTKFNLLQSDLAEMLHVRPNTISNWEHGKTEPDFDSLCTMARFFEVSVDYILGIADTKKPPTSDELDGLTPKQRKLMELMMAMSPEQQDELLKQAEYLEWKLGRREDHP